MKALNTLILAITLFSIPTVAKTKTLNIVTTLPDYAVMARAIGGERVKVKAIVLGNQDAHFIRPKPSFVSMISKADVLISTGLDLELWLPTVVDKSGNTRIRSGLKGYISTSKGVSLMEIPLIKSRSEGGVHVYGNPHITCSPLNIKQAAQNIASGLIANDPTGKEHYQSRLKKFLDLTDKKLFGAKLVSMLGGDTLSRLAEKGKLISFLKNKKYQGKPLIHYLGGWLNKMLPLRGKSVVTYHKNWIYFLKLFDLKEAGTVEPKPGIPPTPKHVTELVEKMKAEKIQIILAANYFDEQKIRTVAKRVNAEPVIVPLYVNGGPNVEDYHKLVDHWIDQLIRAAKKKNLI